MLICEVKEFYLSKYTRVGLLSRCILICLSIELIFVKCYSSRNCVKIHWGKQISSIYDGSI